MYAARGKKQGTYPWGYQLPDAARANYNGTVGDTSAVGSYAASQNPALIQDMAGNVAEWTVDWYGPYPAEEDYEYVIPVHDQYRVVRGGDWSSTQDDIRSSNRFWRSPEEESDTLGFRCAYGG